MSFFHEAESAILEIVCDQALRLKFSTKRAIRAPHRENGSLTRLKTSTFIKGIDRKAGYWPITISGTTVSENNVDVSKTNVEMLSLFDWIWSEDGSSATAVPSEPWEAQSYRGHPLRWELQIPFPRLPSAQESLLQREAISRHPH